MIFVTWLAVLHNLLRPAASNPRLPQHRWNPHLQPLKVQARIPTDAAVSAKRSQCAGVPLQRGWTGLKNGPKWFSRGPDRPTRRPIHFWCTPSWGGLGPMLGHFLHFFHIFSQFSGFLNHLGYFYRFFSVLDRFFLDFSQMFPRFWDDFCLIFRTFGFNRDFV